MKGYVYIVADPGTDYDDERYSIGAGSQGDEMSMIQAFETEKRAQAHADQLNIEWLTEMDTWDAWYPLQNLTFEDWNDIAKVLGREPFVKTTRQSAYSSVTYDDVEGSEDFSLPKNLEEKRLKEILAIVKRHCEMRYKVEKVQLSE